LSTVIPITITCGSKQTTCQPDVANLTKSTNVLIGMDILPKLGIGVVGLPVSSPDAISLPVKDELPNRIAEQSNHEQSVLAISSQDESNNDNYPS
jgi:hypothetical protein